MQHTGPAPTLTGATLTGAPTGATLTGAMRVGKATASAAIAALVAAALAAAAAPAARAATSSDWTVAGRQGIVLVVIVPKEVGLDKNAYDRQIDRLCPPERTCFINFYGNSTGAAPAVPLPESIANEPTALFRRSMKNQAELFRWSCRVNPGATPECF
jgi:hypothetical protein